MLTASLVCCPECQQRVGYLPTGITERHDVAEGVECPAGFPPYVTATKTGEQPMPLHALLDLDPPPVLPPDPAAPYSHLKTATVSWSPW